MEGRGGVPVDLHDFCTVGCVLLVATLPKFNMLHLNMAAYLKKGCVTSLKLT